MIGGAAAFALTLLELVPLIAQGVSGALDVVNSGREMVKVFVDEGRDPTPEEWAKLNDDIAALRSELHTD